MFLVLKTRIVSDKFQIAPSFLASIDIFLYVFLIWKKNVMDVTTALVFLPTTVSSHLVSRVSIHAKVHLCPVRPRFTRRRRRGGDHRAFEPIFIEDTTEKICPPARSKISRALRRLTKRRINRRLSNAIIWLHDSSIERPSSFDFPSILFSPPRDFEICFP